MKKLVQTEDVMGWLKDPSIYGQEGLPQSADPTGPPDYRDKRRLMTKRNDQADWRRHVLRKLTTVGSRFLGGPPLKFVWWNDDSIHREP